MICLAGAVNVLMVYTRNMREFAAVGIWALFAIAVFNRSQPDGENIVYACYALIVVITLFVIRSALKSRGKSIDSM